MSRLYTRGKHRTYWADYVHPATGKRYQRSTRTRDKKVAAERLRQWELATVPESRGRRQRLSEAIAYVVTTMHDKAEGTIEMYEQKAKRIAKTFGDPYVNDITIDSLTDYIALRLSDDPTHGGAAQHTVQKEMIVIRRALKRANKRGILSVMPPLPDFAPAYKPRETWLTESQFAALQAELEPERRLWTGLACLAGGSAGEVERVEWKETLLVDGVLRMPGTKRETRDRWVPISPSLYALLDTVPAKKRTGRVVEPWGNVRRDLHAAIDRANAKDPTAKPIPKVSPNDLRRTFASWLVQSGVDLFTVSKLMGHSSTRMVEKVYGRLTRENMQAAIAKVPAFQRSTVTPLSQNSTRSDLSTPTPALLLDEGSDS
jgi:integrase